MKVAVIVNQKQLQE